MFVVNINTPIFLVTYSVYVTKSMQQSTL